jgi:hypothetical protein
LASAQQSLNSARRERSLDPVKDRYGIAAALRLVGEVQQRSGNQQAAEAAWNAALSQLPKNVTERPRDMNERAAILRLLGRNDEARPLAERLKKAGFRRMS